MFRYAWMNIDDMYIINICILICNKYTWSNHRDAVTICVFIHHPYGNSMQKRVILTVVSQFRGNTIYDQVDITRVEKNLSQQLWYQLT